ncbi:hypothetical protein HYV11_02125 [Candidatus Dependentiae bacterium]|nr:hypothetical protein [Candidatus Dependentiae bacterium]
MKIKNIYLLSSVISLSILSNTMENNTMENKKIIRLPGCLASRTGQYLCLTERDKLPAFVDPKATLIMVSEPNGKLAARLTYCWRWELEGNTEEKAIEKARKHYGEERYKELTEILRNKTA